MKCGCPWEKYKIWLNLHPPASNLVLYQKSTQYMRPKVFSSLPTYRVYTKELCGFKSYKKFISHLTRAQRTPSAAATVQVSHTLPAVRFSCLLRGRGANFQDGVAVVIRHTRSTRTLAFTQASSFHKLSVPPSYVIPAWCVFLSRARNSRYTVITDLDTSKWSTQKAFPAATPSWKLALRPRSKHEKRTAGSA